MFSVRFWWKHCFWQIQTHTQPLISLPYSAPLGRQHSFWPPLAQENIFSSFLSVFNQKWTDVWSLFKTPDTIYIPKVKGHFMRPPFLRNRCLTLTLSGSKHRFWFPYLARSLFKFLLLWTMRQTATMTMRPRVPATTMAMIITVLLSWPSSSSSSSLSSQYVPVKPLAHLQKESFLSTGKQGMQSPVILKRYFVQSVFAESGQTRGIEKPLTRTGRFLQQLHTPHHSSKLLRRKHTHQNVHPRELEKPSGSCWQRN